MFSTAQHRAVRCGTVIPASPRSVLARTDIPASPRAVLARTGLLVVGGVLVCQRSAQYRSVQCGTGVTASLRTVRYRYPHLAAHRTGPYGLFGRGRVLGL